MEDFFCYLGKSKYFCKKKMKNEMRRRLTVLLTCVLATISVSGQQGEKLRVEQLPDLNIARASHSIFYAGGELTVVGGHTAGFIPTPTAEYYSEGAWHLINSVYPHDDGMVVVLDGGQRVLIAGGHEKNLGIGQTFEAEMYYPESHTFDGFNCLDRKRAFSQGVELAGGEVLIAGNHMGNDAMEMYDGSKSFHYLKEVSAWRPSPYVLPISDGEVLIFGSRGVKGSFTFVPCDTVDRLNGKPFRVPLLGEWMPLWFNQTGHTEESFIGDTAAGDYSYIIAAYNESEEHIFIYIKDTVFTPISTTQPIPTTMGYGPIVNWTTAVADRKAHKAYLMGSDSTGRAYLFAIEYDKHPAPLTIYYTDPLQGFGNCTPVLTPDGNLIVAGGISYSNFTPFTSVWLLRVGETEGGKWTSQKVEESKSRRVAIWGVILGVLVAAGVILMRKSRRAVGAHSRVRPSSKGVLPCTPEGVKESGDSDLMLRIKQLMETEQLYLKADLQVADVADALGVPRNTISTCINSQQGCSFSQFVNDYRMNHAKRLLSESPDMKISAVGLNSGFSNERSFFRVFKAATGMTPKEWVTKVESGEQ